MYSVRGDGILIYSDVSATESNKASEPKLTLKDNAAGTLEISLPPGNAGYDALKHMTSEIVVRKGHEDIWHGRIITENMDFWNNRKLTCEGELAYLNDTTQPPHKYAEGITVSAFLEAALAEHNKRFTDERYRFYADASRIYNAEETLPEIVTDYESTLDCIIQNVVEKFECHIRIERDADGKKYLGFVKDESTFSENTQVIRFGDNLLDFTRNWDLTDLATVVIPRGKQLETKADEDSDELDKYVGLGEIPLTDVVAKSEFGYYERVGGGTPVIKRNAKTGKYEWDDNQNKSNHLAHVNNDVNDSLIKHYYDEIDEDTGELVYQYKVENGYITLEKDADEKVTIRVNVRESSENKKIVEFLEDVETSPGVWTREVTSKIETDDTYCVVYLKDENGDFYSLKDTYGHVEQVVDFSDVEDSIELLKKTRDYIKEHRFDGMTLEVSAVDLHYLSSSTEPVKMLDRMRCISYPHGMNTLFTVTELSIQLDKPDSAKYTLEKTMRIGARQSAISDSMSAVEAEVESAHSTILTRAKQTADKILREKTNGYVNLVTDTTGGRHSQALVISSSRDWEHSEHFWVWNVNGLGHYTEYGGDDAPVKAPDDPKGEMFKGYELNVGITMDGAIVANRITVGHMSADRVRTGVLVSEDGNVIWSLNKHGNYNLNDRGEYIPNENGAYVFVPETGEYVKAGSMVIKKGSITLGVDETHPNGHFSVNNNGYLISEYGKIGGFEIESDNIHNDAMMLNDEGIHLWVDKKDIGYLGTSYWTNEPSKKALAMNMEHDGSGIWWGYRQNSSDDTFTVKLLYAAKTFDKYAKDRLYVECDMDVYGDIDLHRNIGKNFWIDSETGGANGGMNGTIWVMTSANAINDDGTVNKSGFQKVTLQNGFIV